MSVIKQIKRPSASSTEGLSLRYGILFFDFRLFREDDGTDDIGESARSGAEECDDPKDANNCRVDVEIFGKSAAHAANLFSFFYFV